MTLFIHEDPIMGLNYETEFDLRIMAGNDALITFEPGMTRPGFSGETFTKVRCTLVDTSIGATTIDIVANAQYTDVLIFPKHYSDQYNDLLATTATMVIEGPGHIFSDPPDVYGFINSRIYYDATPVPEALIDEVFWLVKDASGNCIDMPRYVILFHELAHAADPLFLTNTILPEEVKAKTDSEEVNTRWQENQLRIEMGLPERDYDLSRSIDLQIMTKRQAKNTNWCP